MNSRQESCLRIGESLAPLLFFRVRVNSRSIARIRNATRLLDVWHSCSRWKNIPSPIVPLDRRECDNSIRWQDDVFSLTRKTSEVRLSRVRMPGRWDWNTGSPTAFQSQPNLERTSSLESRFQWVLLTGISPRSVSSETLQSSVPPFHPIENQSPFNHNFLDLLRDQASDSEVHGFHWEILENFQRPSRYGSKGIPLPHHNFSGSQGRSHIALLLWLWRGGAPIGASLITISSYTTQCWKPHYWVLFYYAI